MIVTMIVTVELPSSVRMELPSSVRLELEPGDRNPSPLGGSCRRSQRPPLGGRYSQERLVVLSLVFPIIWIPRDFVVICQYSSRRNLDARICNDCFSPDYDHSQAFDSSPDVAVGLRPETVRRSTRTSRGGAVNLGRRRVPGGPERLNPIDNDYWVCRTRP